MVYKEQRSYNYNFYLEKDFLQKYFELEDNYSSYLQFKITKSLFDYLKNKFLKDVEHNPQYFYNFNHADVKIYLTTNDIEKIDDISCFIQSVMDKNQLIDIYWDSISTSKFSKKYEIKIETFNASLDKIYDCFLLNKELSNNNLGSNKKIKI